MSLHLDSVGLEVQPAVAEVIEDVGDIAARFADLADSIGRAEVERRNGQFRGRHAVSPAKHYHGHDAARPVPRWERFPA
jgi:hypothetical protein